MNYFLEGLAVGFFVATPVGPVGVLCIRRFLTVGLAAGFASGLGAACADSLFAALASFGVTFISAYLLDNSVPLRAVGALFLLWMGFRVFRARPCVAEGVKVLSLVGDFTSAFLLTLSNPVVLATFTAAFAVLRVDLQEGGLASMRSLVGGVFSGVASWWVVIGAARAIFRGRFNEKGVRWINRTAGVAIAGGGLLILVSILVWRR
jgi:threonine/homoserine/homoserine lactone efflux protein